MPPRTSWKGFIKLSLISVPVRAFTAHDTSEEIRLNQLHRDCHARVRYRKMCPEHGELKADDIVSGYEYGKDQYVVIDPDELAKMRPESDRSVRIEGFVRADEIDPIYQAGRTYYLLPDGPAGGKPYALLHRGMVDNGLVALAQVVVSGREQLVVVRPLDQLLVMSVLTVSKRIKSVHEFTTELPKEEMSSEELSLTNTLIEASTIQDFEYARYQDAYVEKLSELIRLKVDGQEVVEAPEREEPKIINLMEALKKSVAEAQTAADAASGASGKKMAPSAGRKKRSAKRKSG